MTDTPTNSGDEGLAALPPESSTIADYYDDWADRYDLDVQSWGYAAPRTAAARLAGLIDTSLPVADVGCGTGLTGVALRDAGFAVIDGVDISEPSLAEAASRLVYRDLAVADIQAPPLPLQTDGYAGAICIGVATYVADVATLFDELVRIVVPGGAVIVTQRTDLWDPRGTDAAIDRIADDGRWVATVSEPEPYLPGNAEYGTDVEVRYVVAQVS